MTNDTFLNLIGFSHVLSSIQTDQEKIRLSNPTSKVLHMHTDASADGSFHCLAAITNIPTSPTAS